MIWLLLINEGNEWLLLINEGKKWYGYCLLTKVRNDMVTAY